eukprot:TRINITY_DN1790_c0_g1_i1.p1 TRINITY_DN1790_c0_g1~~TRINITY_DN1790_c0_g1_i1.p1  ORF type:complete len:525 (+),score=105.41 TRINITY_DN1790_c0_g1_i1:21-1595(+)
MEADTTVDKKAIEAAILAKLVETGVIEDSLQLAASLNVSNTVLAGVLTSLAAHFIVELTVQNVETTVLTEAGEALVRDGSPEAQLWAATADGNKLVKAQLTGALKEGFSEAMKKKFVVYDKPTDSVSRSATSINDDVRTRLTAFKNGELTLEAKEKVILTKRKLIKDEKTKKFRITKGEKFTTEGVVKKQLDLTADMLASGSWKTDQFKEYNLETLGAIPVCGHLHPLMKVRSAFREIFLEMGFEEMRTNNFVESSFWNFDALFQPQQHPSREAHDTFFLTEPAKTLSYPADFCQRVKAMHETGGFGSIGYRYDWKEEEASKNVLRTHTTAVSTRALYELAQSKPFVPKKYFSIDRVYRNETLDTTHLAEFHQIEGLVADYDLTLADLIGIISQFFLKWGMTELKFKPAFNPYTEPSMEIFALHKGFNPPKWIEIGNSGIFRPEMLLPMGLDPKVRVIAWGLGLERPTMIRYGIKNIRDLVGHKVSLTSTRLNPTCDLQLEDAYDAAKFVKEKQKVQQTSSMQQ